MFSHSYVVTFSLLPLFLDLVIRSLLCEFSRPIGSIIQYFFCLQQRVPPVEISDVVVDLMDGKMLLNLLEVLLNTSLVKVFLLIFLLNLVHIFIY